MRIIIVSEFVSLDGVSEAQGGEETFKGFHKADLELVESNPLSTGVVRLHYQPVKS